jgi:hypothetical protein
MFLQLAQAAGGGETLGILTTLLDGGLPLLLLVALCIVGYLYKNEKEAKDAEVVARISATETHSGAISALKTEYSTKVESLLRERIESESEMQKALSENKEIMQAVVMTMNNCNSTLESVLED